MHVRLRPNNINRDIIDNRNDIPEAWTPTIKKHNSRRTVLQRTAARATTSRWDNRRVEDRNTPITTDFRDTNGEP